MISTHSFFCARSITPGLTLVSPQMITQLAFLLDGDKLARRDISHDDQIIILDLITHGLPVAGCYDDLALVK